MSADNRGKCRACGLTFTHKSEHPIPIGPDQ